MSWFDITSIQDQLSKGLEEAQGQLAKGLEEASKIVDAAQQYEMLNLDLLAQQEEEEEKLAEYYETMGLTDKDIENGAHLALPNDPKLRARVEAASLSASHDSVDSSHRVKVNAVPNLALGVDDIDEQEDDAHNNEDDFHVTALDHLSPLVSRSPESKRKASNDNIQQGNVNNFLSSSTTTLLGSFRGSNSSHGRSVETAAVVTKPRSASINSSVFSGSASEDEYSSHSQANSKQLPKPEKTMISSLGAAAPRRPSRSDENVGSISSRKDGTKASLDSASGDDSVPKAGKKFSVESSGQLRPLNDTTTAVTTTTDGTAPSTVIKLTVAPPAKSATIKSINDAWDDIDIEDDSGSGREDGDDDDDNNSVCSNKNSSPQQPLHGGKVEDSRKADKADDDTASISSSKLSLDYADVSLSARSTRASSVTSLQIQATQVQGQIQGQGQQVTSTATRTSRTNSVDSVDVTKSKITATNAVAASSEAKMVDGPGPGVAVADGFKVDDLEFAEPAVPSLRKDSATVAASGTASGTGSGGTAAASADATLTKNDNEKPPMPPPHVQTALSEAVAKRMRKKKQQQEIDKQQQEREKQQQEKKKQQQEIDKQQQEREKQHQEKKKQQQQQQQQPAEAESGLDFFGLGSVAAMAAAAANTAGSTVAGTLTLPAAAGGGSSSASSSTAAAAAAAVAASQSVADAGASLSALFDDGFTLALGVLGSGNDGGASSSSSATTNTTLKPTPAAPTAENVVPPPAAASSSSTKTRSPPSSSSLGKTDSPPLAKPPSSSSASASSFSYESMLSSTVSDAADAVKAFPTRFVAGLTNSRMSATSKSFFDNVDDEIDLGDDPILRQVTINRTNPNPVPPPSVPLSSRVPLPILPQPIDIKGTNLHTSASVPSSSSHSSASPLTNRGHHDDRHRVPSHANTGNTHTHSTHHSHTPAHPEISLSHQFHASKTEHPSGGSTHAHTPLALSSSSFVDIEGDRGGGTTAGREQPQQSTTSLEVSWASIIATFAVAGHELRSIIGQLLRYSNDAISRISRLRRGGGSGFTDTLTTTFAEERARANGGRTSDFGDSISSDGSDSHSGAVRWRAYLLNAWETISSVNGIGTSVVCALSCVTSYLFLISYCPIKLFSFSQCSLFL
jgi:hypothetical protein